ncbi:YueI family protein [Ferdinandcohnia sp. Marseille-Q9671]
MANKNVDDILQQGIHGVKETKPEERKKFLGTIRERVLLALKQPQVRENKIYPDVEEACKNNSGVHMYLNGNMNYRFLSKYVKLAGKYNVQYTLVTNKEHNSELGLVLAYDYAIDKEDIYINKKVQLTPPVQNQAQKKKGFFSFFKRG